MPWQLQHTHEGISDALRSGFVQTFQDKTMQAKPPALTAADMPLGHPQQYLT